MPCQRVFLSIGEPGGDSLAGTLRVKGSISGFLFLDPKDIKILGNVVLRGKLQSTFCVSVRSWLHSGIHIWVPSFWKLRILEN